VEVMSTADAAFLHAETPSAPMHVAAAAIFEGPPPTFDEIVAMLERKLPLLPRYRQRVRFVPNDLGRPVWVDYPRFDLSFHVRRTALASPGTDEELKALGARVLSQALDRAKPLWELWMVEGLADGRWALFSKTHHCMVDGVSGTSLLSTIFNDDLSAESEPWAPGREPTDQELVMQALAAHQLSVAEQMATWGELMEAHNPKTAMTRYAQFHRGTGPAAPSHRGTRPFLAAGARRAASALDLGALPPR